MDDEREGRGGGFRMIVQMMKEGNSTMAYTLVYAYLVKTIGDSTSKMRHRQLSKRTLM